MVAVCPARTAEATSRIVRVRSALMSEFLEIKHFSDDGPD
jgi:hypothetical protein